MRNGIPTTSPARTIVDLAASATDDELELAVAAALAQGLTTEPAQGHDATRQRVQRHQGHLEAARRGAVPRGRSHRTRAGASGVAGGACARARLAELRLELKLLGQQTVVDPVEPLRSPPVSAPADPFARETGPLEQALACHVVSVDLRLDAVEFPVDEDRATHEPDGLDRDARATGIRTEHHAGEVADPAAAVDHRKRQA